MAGIHISSEYFAFRPSYRWECEQDLDSSHSMWFFIESNVTAYYSLQFLHTADIEMWWRRSNAIPSQYPQRLTHNPNHRRTTNRFNICRSNFIVNKVSAVLCLYCLIGSTLFLTGYLVCVVFGLLPFYEEIYTVGCSIRKITIKKQQSKFTGEKNCTKNVNTEIRLKSWFMQNYFNGKKYWIYVDKGW